MELHRFVMGGEIVESDGLVMETSWIMDPLVRHRLFQRFPFVRGWNDLQRKFLNLKPRFPPEENQIRYSGREWVFSLWGCRPPAPGGQTALRDTIVDILTTRLIMPARFLAWHIDGNPTNCGLANLQAVTIGEALANPSWYVDWWRFLEGDLEMISYVRTYPKHFANIFRVRNGSKVYTEFDCSRIRFHFAAPDFFHTTNQSPPTSDSVKGSSPGSAPGTRSNSSPIHDSGKPPMPAKDRGRYLEFEPNAPDVPPFS
jgi:hypothetical protein